MIKRICLNARAVVISPRKGYMDIILTLLLSLIFIELVWHNFHSMLRRSYAIIVGFYTAEVVICLRPGIIDCISLKISFVDHDRRSRIARKLICLLYGRNPGIVKTDVTRCATVTRIMKLNSMSRCMFRKIGVSSPEGFPCGSTTLHTHWTEKRESFLIFLVENGMIMFLKKHYWHVSTINLQDDPAASKSV